MCAFHYRWFITDGLLHGLRMVYCVVYCRCSNDYDSHLNRNDDPTCAVVSQMTADDVGLGTVHTYHNSSCKDGLCVFCWLSMLGMCWCRCVCGTLHVEYLTISMMVLHLFPQQQVRYHSTGLLLKLQLQLN